MSTAIPPEGPDTSGEVDASREIPETQVIRQAQPVSLGSRPEDVSAPAPAPAADPGVRSAAAGHAHGGWRDAVPGLLKGLATTAKTLTRPSHTQEYPDALPSLPPRSRGVIALLEENCTSCMLCARECPDWCIYIDSHKETLPATAPGGRERQRNVLDRFAIDFSLCMYCGICIEVCPFDALHWSPEFEYAELDIRDLLHEKGRLGQWMPTVPPPPALDPGSAEPAEVAAANRPARPARSARPERSAQPAAAAAAAAAEPTSATTAQAAAAAAPTPPTSSPARPEDTAPGVTPPPRDDSGVPAPGETT